MSALWARKVSLPIKIWIAFDSLCWGSRSITVKTTVSVGSCGAGLLDLDDAGCGTASGKYTGSSTVLPPRTSPTMRSSNPSFCISGRPKNDLNDAVQTAAYRRASCLKLVFIQQRMMAGTVPRTSRPGAMAGVCNGDLLASPKPYPVSRFKLLARPDAADRTECTELARPSDLCDEDRSVIGKPPRPLLLLGMKSTDDREA